MENHSNLATKKGLILLLGVIIGLLTGVLVTFVMVNKLNNRPPKDDGNTAQPISDNGSSDTIYKYIVHRYESDGGIAQPELAADSLPDDSLYMENGYDDYMLDDETDPLYAEMESATVASAKMMSKEEAPILYFDANRNPVKAPENVSKFVEVQFWSTPIQNKVVYAFDGNVLKIKGLKSEDVYVIHYKDRYYMQCNKRVYQISLSNEYKRLTEIQEGTFF